MRRPGGGAHLGLLALDLNFQAQSHSSTYVGAKFGATRHMTPAVTLKPKALGISPGVCQVALSPGAADWKGSPCGSCFRSSPFFLSLMPRAPLTAASEQLTFTLWTLDSGFPRWLLRGPSQAALTNTDAPSGPRVTGIGGRPGHPPSGLMLGHS